MTFSRLDLLPRNDLDEAKRARERWAEEDGRKLAKRIIQLIRGGDGEDFLVISAF